MSIVILKSYLNREPEFNVVHCEFDTEEEAKAFLHLPQIVEVVAFFDLKEESVIISQGIAFTLKLESDGGSSHRPVSSFLTQIFEAGHKSVLDNLSLERK